MKTKIHKCLLLGCLVGSLLSTPILAQETKVVQDLKLWTGAMIEKELAGDLTLSFKQEFRFEHNMSEMDNIFSQFGLGYRINKNFSLAAKYRYIINNTNRGTTESWSRYSLDFRFRGDLSIVTLNYRLRYQKLIESMNIFDNQQLYEKHLRHRLTLKYNRLGRFEPYLSAEIFQLFEFSEFPEYDMCRFIAGISYEPGNYGEFRMAYGLERELNASFPFLNHLVRINYIYKF